MNKNVESNGKATEPQDFKVAKEARSLLYDLKWRFEELQKLLRVYIPDYSIGYEKVYSLNEVCKIYTTCKKIENIVWNLKDKDIVGDIIKEKPAINLEEYIIQSNCATKEDFSILNTYIERFNGFYHLLLACRTMDVDVHNAIHTVFKTTNTKTLDRISSFINKAETKLHAFTTERNYCTEFDRIRHVDINKRVEDYLTYFYLLKVDEAFDRDKFRKVYDEYIHTQDFKTVDFETYLVKEPKKWAELEKMQSKPNPEFNDLWANYAAFFHLVNDEEKYDKLFEDWRDNHRPNGITFETYLVENGYLLANKKSRQGKKTRSNIKAKTRN